MTTAYAARSRVARFATARKCSLGGFACGSTCLRMLATLIDFAMPKNLRTLIRIQEWVELIPRQAVTGRSGMRVVIIVPALAEGEQATHQLLRESSRVSNRRLPHMWVAELTSQVECRPTTTRKQTPHKNSGSPPEAQSTAAQHD